MSNISFLTDIFKKLTDHPDTVAAAAPMIDAVDAEHAANLPALTPAQVQTAPPDQLPPVTPPNTNFSGVQRANPNSDPNANFAGGVPDSAIRYQSPVDLQIQPQLPNNFSGVPTVNRPLNTPANIPQINPPDTATRPRVVPDIPITQDAGITDPSSNGNMNVPSIPANQPNLPAISADPTAAALADKKSGLAEILGRDYSTGIWRNPKTGLTTGNEAKAKAEGYTEIVHAPGKDRAKTWPLSTKILSAIAGWAQGGLIGGVKAATDRNYFQRMRDDNEKAALLPEIGALQGIQAKDANTDWYKARPDIAARTADIAQQRVYNQQDETARKATHAKMVAVMNILKQTPTFIPGDPKYKALEDALGGLQLPVTRKDSKKNIRLVQDARTGGWNLVLTDPTANPTDANAIETRPVPNADGTGQLTTTPTVQVQNEATQGRFDTTMEFRRQEAQRQADQFQQSLNQKIAAEQRSGAYKKAEWEAKLDGALKAGQVTQADHDRLVQMLPE